MWRSIGRSPDRFSVHHFRDIANELRRINYVDFQNGDVVVDLMQTIAEIATYGDKHNPAIFECFMELQVLPEFVRILRIRGSSRIEAPLLQYMSIMVQNIENEHAIYYFLSNGYINSIIGHEFDFEAGDVVPYYVSFLRAVGGKIDRDTVCLLVKVAKDAVVSFPLYEAALKFVHYGEKMIQIAIRALILKIYKVADEMIFLFLTSPPVSNYFSGLIINLENKCFRIEAITTGLEDNCSDKKRELLLETERLVDDFYYLKDILSIPDHCLNKLVTKNIVDLLVLPMLLSLVVAKQITDRVLSPITCLCILSRLLQVLEGTNLVNVISSAMLYFGMPGYITADLQLKGAETVIRNNFLKYSSQYIDLTTDERLSCLPMENRENECCFECSNQTIILASLLLLFIVADSKELDHQLAEIIGFSEVKTPSECNQSIFTRQARKMVNQLLKVLASNPSGSAAMLFQTAWILRKLLVFLDQKLDDHDYHLFKTSWELSCERLCRELSQCWFDYVPDTLKNEWDICITVLEESSHSKDPFFFLELASFEVAPTEISGNEDAAFNLQGMVDHVKVFVLHLQLKSFICGSPLDNPLANWKSRSLAQSGKRYASDISLASFGSEVALGSGIPCKIAFSGAGPRDIYVIPISREISGKLFLVEQHPLHSRKGVVIAIAPLAGLNPKIDENHPTWLHLQLREFHPIIHSNDRYRIVDSGNSIPVAQGRWTLGFSDADVCQAAYSRIIEETTKQRSFVESLITPLLEFPENN